MKNQVFRLLLGAGLVLGLSGAAHADYWHHGGYHHGWNGSGFSISVGTAPVYGYPYEQYNGYYYYPSYSAPSAGVYPIIQYNNSWGYWDHGHQWHNWGGPHHWRR